jgi:hypothetical protein
VYCLPKEPVQATLPTTYILLAIQRPLQQAYRQHKATQHILPRPTPDNRKTVQENLTHNATSRQALTSFLQKRGRQKGIPKVHLCGTIMPIRMLKEKSTNRQRKVAATD